MSHKTGYKMAENSGALLALVFILCMGGFMVAFIAWALTKINAAQKALAEHARQRGWEFNPTKRGYTYQIRGQTGRIHWLIQERSSHSRSSAAGSRVLTTWRSDDINLPHLELIVRSPKELAMENNPLVNPMFAAMNMVSEKMSGFQSEHGELLKSGVKLQLPDPALKNQFVIITRSPALVERLFTQQVQEGLVRWLASPAVSEYAKTKLHIDLGQTSLRLYVNESVTQPEAIDLMVSLGSALAHNYLYPPDAGPGR